MNAFFTGLPESIKCSRTQMIVATDSRAPAKLIRGRQILLNEVSLSKTAPQDLGGRQHMLIPTEVIVAHFAEPSPQIRPSIPHNAWLSKGGMNIPIHY